MKKIFLGGLIVIFTLALSTSFALADVSNESFEIGTNPGAFTTLYPGNTNIDGWTIISGSVDYIGSYWTAADGSRSIDMNGLAAGTISQEFDTETGATYKVTFYMSGNPDSSSNPSLTSPSEKVLTVSAAGYTSDPFTFDSAFEANSKSDMKWKQNTYNFVASGEKTTISFASVIGGAFGPALDNISIERTDIDGDGILNEEDICPGTDIDIPSVGHGVNRHWYNGSSFMTMVPNGKTGPREVLSQFSLKDTNGCSCKQILDNISEKTGFDFGGHYKYGCSKSIIDDWISGRYLIETVDVPAQGAVISSVYPLILGANYVLKARGIADAQNQTPSIWFDAECSNNTGISSSWVDGVEGYESYGLDLLDLKVNNQFVDWGSCNPAHEYEKTMVGTGSNTTFQIYDVYYPNNSGNLFVDIYAEL